jgi:hypothetical protein
MPRHDSLTISPFDMKSILEALQSKQYNGTIKIIDTLDSYTVRDVNDQFLTEIKKAEQ